MKARPARKRAVGREKGDCRVWYDVDDVDGALFLSSLMAACSRVNDDLVSRSFLCDGDTMAVMDDMGC